MGGLVGQHRFGGFGAVNSDLGLPKMVQFGIRNVCAPEKQQSKLDPLDVLAGGSKGQVSGIVYGDGFQIQSGANRNTPSKHGRPQWHRKASPLGSVVHRRISNPLSRLWRHWSMPLKT